MQMWILQSFQNELSFSVSIISHLTHGIEKCTFRNILLQFQKKESSNSLILLSQEHEESGSIQKQKL